MTPAWIRTEVIKSDSLPPEQRVSLNPVWIPLIVSPAAMHANMITRRHRTDFIVSVVLTSGPMARIERLFTCDQC